MHRVHVRSHQCRDIHPARAILAAFATLLTELRRCGKCLVGQKHFFVVGVCQVSRDSKVLFQMFVGAESRDRRRHELVIQGPLQQCRLAENRKQFGKLRVRSHRTTGLGLHGNNSNSTIRRPFDGLQHFLIVRHGVIEHHQRDIEHVEPYCLVQYRHCFVSRDPDKPRLPIFFQSLQRVEWPFKSRVLGRINAVVVKHVNVIQLQALQTELNSLREALLRLPTPDLPPRIPCLVEMIT